MPKVLFIGEIKNQLRKIVTTPPLVSGLPIVVSNRETGKTAGLVQFVGSRILELDDDSNVAVITPTENIGLEFLHQFKEFFPRLKEPIVRSAINLSMFRAQGIKEAYIEEVFHIDSHLLHEICQDFPIVAGVEG